MIKTPKQKSIFRFFQSWSNSLLFLLVLTIALIFKQQGYFSSLIFQLEPLGVFASSVVGFFTVSVFTAAPAFIVLYGLTEKTNVLLVSVFSGFGAMLGDYLVFRFFKQKIWQEWQWFFEKSSFKGLDFLRSRKFRWLIPFFGALIIASPIPDEIGIALMGFSHLKNWQFIFLTLFLNILGIYLILESAIIIVN